MSPQKIAEVVAAQRSFFESGATRSLDFRRAQLMKLRQALKDFEGEVLAGLHADMRKPRTEAWVTEIGVCLSEASHTLKHLRCWARPRKVHTPLVNFKGTSRVHSEPLGVTLIIAPWNYPFMLLIAPLIASIAAGNTAVLKPSELAPQTSKAIAKMIAATFDPSYVAVVEGAVPETTALLEQVFDHIFFTGGITVGKIVMAAAAKHLTPLTLELGGKSPCIVDAGVDVALSARRIAWGKFVNAGQTCVAPDYLLVHKSVKGALLDEMKKSLLSFYGADPRQSPDYARINNDRHFSRLAEHVKEGSGRLVTGGALDAGERYIAPAIIDRATLQDRFMADEIFGPVLPVLEYSDIDEALAVVRQRSKPLAFYAFTRDVSLSERLLREVQFGGGCINDTVMHLGCPDLPFGGIGPSGMGSYHGQTGFDLFSHKKAVLTRSTLFDIRLRYPPYSEKKLSIMRWFFG